MNTECVECGKIPEPENWNDFKYTEEGFLCRQCNPDLNTGEDRSDIKCRLCGRQDVEITSHHLVPKSQGGEDTDDNKAYLCVSCHRKVHATFSNYELEHKYDTVEKLEEAPQMKGYIQWIKKTDKEAVKFKESNRSKYL